MLELRLPKNVSRLKTFSNQNNFMNEIMNGNVTKCFIFHSLGVKQNSFYETDRETRLKQMFQILFHGVLGVKQAWLESNLASHRSFYSISLKRAAV